jgi:hypothetical protein
MIYLSLKIPLKFSYSILINPTFWLSKYFIHLHIMKYLAVLFGFYLISLALMPCGDVFDNTAGAKTAYSLHKVTEGTEKCNHEACAPFCGCNCCSVGKNFPLQFVYVKIEPLLLVSYSLYPVSMPNSQALEVWQPPKLA